MLGTPKLGDLALLLMPLLLILLLLLYPLPYFTLKKKTNFALQNYLHLRQTSAVISRRALFLAQLRRLYLIIAQASAEKRCTKYSYSNWF